MSHRVGIYPGTFDPIHAGHMALANEALRVCGLDEVVFLPEQTPRGKQGVTDITHRIAMIEQVIKHTPQLKVVRINSEQFDVAHTLPELQKMYPSSKLTFLIGSDVAKSLLQWQGIESLIHEVSFAIGVRSTDTVKEIESAVRKIKATYTIIQTPAAHITSTQVRFDTSLIVPSTKPYIEKNRLYDTLNKIEI